MKKIGVYKAGKIEGEVRVGRSISPSDGMPWSGAYNPHPEAPFWATKRKRLWKKVEGEEGCVWVELIDLPKTPPFLRIIQIGGTFEEANKVDLGEVEIPDTSIESAAKRYIENL